MSDQLVVFHKYKPEGNEKIPQGVPLWSFSTCLRSLHFSYLNSQEDVAPRNHDFEVRRGPEAYGFLLEILCGLHSPVVGETEVFGQFRQFLQRQSQLQGPMASIFQKLVGDVKRVRKTHLVDLGSQSYGSLIRRLIPKESNIAMIGSGSLVQDILPWIYKDENQVTLAARSPLKARPLQRTHSRLNVVPLEQAQLDQPVVIVAAPVTSEQVETMVSNKKNTWVFDLRGESRRDPCQGFSNYKSLDDFFKVIHGSKQAIERAKCEALKMIEAIANEQQRQERPRPFGWDDLFC